MRQARVNLKWAVALVVFSVASTSLAATAVNTIPLWTGGTIQPFGVPDTQTYGQTVTVPPGESSITSFRFLINDQGTAIQFLAEVYAWDSVNNFITGPSLFESAPLTTAGVNSFQSVTITIPGGASVTAGQVYCIFLTTSKSAQVASTGHWGTLSDTSYNGGGFVFQNNGNNFGNLSTVAWSVVGIDAAFGVAYGGASLDANLVPMLSGSMMALLAGALVLVGIIVLRMRAS